MDRTHIALAGIAGLLFATACEPAAEYRAALPTEDTVTVDVPENGTTSSGLSSRTDALVGEKSDFYAETYYTARNINVLGKAVVGLVEGISRFPSTRVGEDHAIWGPFSDDNEPNEFMMTVHRADAAGSRYDWRIEGKHKADDQFLILASGSFEPKGEDLGRGWFELDFDTIGQLDPTESARGQVAYAFEKTEKDVNVRVRFAGPDERTGDRIEAGYAFGETVDGDGFILFAFPGDIHEDEKPGSAAEDVVIRTRWIAGGAGRADVTAENGDLDGSIAQASQCWDDRFVSRYEVMKIDGEIIEEAGEARACVLPDSIPGRSELPTANDVQNPFSQKQ